MLQLIIANSTETIDILIVKGFVFLKNSFCFFSFLSVCSLKSTQFSVYTKQCGTQQLQSKHWIFRQKASCWHHCACTKPCTIWAHPLTQAVTYCHRLGKKWWHSVKRVNLANKLLLLALDLGWMYIFRTVNIVLDIRLSKKSKQLEKPPWWN